MSVDDTPTNEIADLEKRLAELDRERLNVLAATNRRFIKVEPVPLQKMCLDVFQKKI